MLDYITYYVNQMTDVRFSIYSGLIIATIIRFFAIFIRVASHKRTTFLHEITAWLFWFYMWIVFSLTLGLGLYKAFIYHQFTLDGNINFDIFSVVSQAAKRGDWNYIALNVGGNFLLLMPFGIMLPLLWPKMASVFKTVPLACLISFMIEFIQYFIDRQTDIDDLVINTLGALVGYWGFCILRGIFPKLHKHFACKPKKSK